MGKKWLYNAPIVVFPPSHFSGGNTDYGEKWLNKTGTLGQEKRYMHINVYTLTHIYMKGDEREHIHIYQSARDTLSRC